jgi:guanylate kinase
MQQGLLVVVSSPSGGGKDSVINGLLKIFKNSTRIITTTSRKPRPGNKDGIDYHFISEAEFKEKLKNGDFVEHNIYASNYYGMQKKHLAEALKDFEIVFTQIEVNGKHNLDKEGISHFSVYLIPENFEILKERIKKRGGISDQVIEKRLNIAKKEMEESVDYDFRIVNKEGRLNETINVVADKIKDVLAVRKSNP